jgi:hypothetical protein
MSKLLSTPHSSRKKERMSVPKSKPTNIFITNSETPFDDSVYESNQNHQPSTVKHDARRTQ